LFEQTEERARALRICVHWSRRQDLAIQASAAAECGIECGAIDGGAGADGRMPSA
jgi:hypothetical protein